MTKTFAFAAATAAALAASPALAQDRHHTTEVVYADLDLTSDAGVDRLDARIRSAVSRVCSTTATPDRIEQRWVNNCRRETTAQVTHARDEAVRIARSGERQAPELARLQIAAPSRN